MKRNKAIEIILSLMTKVKIKDKRIQYSVLVLLGIALAAATQLTSLEGDISSIEPSKTVVEQVVEDTVRNSVEEAIESILENLL